MEKELPKNWVLGSIGGVLNVQMGQSPPSSSYNVEGKGMPFMQGKTEFGEIYPEIVKYTTDPKKIIKKDSILLSVRAPIGPTNIAKTQMCIGRGLAGLSSELIKPNFILYYLRSIEGVLDSVGTGTTFKAIAKERLFKVNFPLPPKAEQVRIVTKLDKLFGQLDEIKQRIKNLNSIRNRFIYSCFINTHTTDFFPRQKIGTYLEEGTERIGKKWEENLKIGVSAKKGIIDLRTGQKKTFENYKVVRPGDFIYNTMRVNIGSVAIYTGKENAITSPDYVVFRVKNFLSSELLLGFLKSGQGLLEIGANTKGSVRARLYFKSLSEIRMPVSGEETQIIAQKFLSTFSISLSKLKKISKTKFVDIEKAILNKAFKGELVPQLESDGDARDLLEEIRKLKEESSAKFAKGKRKSKKYETGEELSMAAEVIEKYEK